MNNSVNNDLDSLVNKLSFFDWKSYPCEHTQNSGIAKTAFFHWDFADISYFFDLFDPQVARWICEYSLSASIFWQEFRPSLMKLFLNLDFPLLHLNFPFQIQNDFSMVLGHIILSLVMRFFQTDLSFRLHYLLEQAKRIRHIYLCCLRWWWTLIQQFDFFFLSFGGKDLIRDNLNFWKNCCFSFKNFRFVLRYASELNRIFRN